MLECLLQFKPKFFPKTAFLTYDEVTKIYNFILMDHPEIFWLQTYSASGFGNHIITFLPINIIYGYSREEAIEKNEKMKLSYEPIINEASKLKTEREKIRYTRDKLMEIATWDKTEGNRDYYCMCSIFETGKTMCGGYGYGYKFLMDRLGIKCICVINFTGEASSSHIWNMLYVDDKWYDMDIAFDDERRDLYNLEGEEYYMVEDHDKFEKARHKRNEYTPR